LPGQSRSLAQVAQTPLPCGEHGEGVPAEQVHELLAQSELFVHVGSETEQ
jgi:hypothetical protein